MTRLLMVVLLWWGCVAPVSAEALLRKDGIILSVSGAIERHNEKDAFLFTYDTLSALGLSRIRTSTPWTDGVPEFEGVLVSRVVDYLGGKGSTMVVTALNDYRVEIPMEDVLRYPVLFAVSMDGQRLTPRDKGPIWIIYPRDQFAELRGEKARTRSVWQLKSIEFK